MENCKSAYIQHKLGILVYYDLTKIITIVLYSKIMTILIVFGSRSLKKNNIFITFSQYIFY